MKFSFERYRGASKDMLKEWVAGVETPEAACPLPAARAVARFLDLLWDRDRRGWIVPKKYVEQVGDEGFKKAPIGAGPYKFVSFKPGVELVLEAFEGYWPRCRA